MVAIKQISTEFDQSARIYVTCYGYEDISGNAHWGRGSRDAFILHYVLSGEGYFNGCKVKSGQGFLITPDLIHAYHSSKDRPWTYFWVMFSGEDAAAICKKFISADENHIFTFDASESKLIDLISSIMGNTGQLPEPQALGYFYMLLSCHQATTEIAGNQHVQLAKKYMKIHIYRSVTITEVAKVLGISDRYLYNLFKKHLNISPKQYLNDLKVAYAKGLLKSTKDTISEIAISAGFPDVLTFSRFFKKHTGISPTQFRTRQKS